MIFNYNALEALSIVRKHSSISKAAHELGITQAAVSIRIKQLEDSFGKAVLNRGKGLHLTEFGEELLLHFHKVKLLEADTLKTKKELIHIPVAINVESLELWFLKAIQDFLEKNPRCRFEFIINDQDMTNKRLVEAKALVGISSQAQCPPGFESVFLGKLSYVFVGNPSLLKKHSLNSRQVDEIPICRFSVEDQLHLQYLEKYFPKKKFKFLEYIIPSTGGLLQAALSGLGYVVLPLSVAQSYIQKGQLQLLDANHVYKIELFYLHSTFKTEMLSELEEAIKKGAKSFLSYD